MTLRRIGAVLVAVVLVAGALVLRRTVLDDDTASTPDDTTATTTPQSAPASTVVCITELADLCAEIRARVPDVTVSVEDAGVTLDELAVLPDDVPRPLWVTIQPFPAMVDELRVANRLEPFGATAEAVGASPLAVATRPGRADVLIASCAGRPLWACIGEDAGVPWADIGGDPSWGEVRPWLGDVDQQAMALASFAAAVAGYVGRPDIRSSDWRDDPAFVPWLRRLSGTVDGTLLAGSPITTMIVRPAVDVAATSEIEVAAIGSDRFDVNYPEPSMWVEAVVAVPEGTSSPDGLVAVVDDTLASAGWSPAGSAAQALPGPTTMLALRDQWQEVT